MELRADGERILRVERLQPTYGMLNRVVFQEVDLLGLLVQLKEHISR